MVEFISEDLKLAVKKGAIWLDDNHVGWETKLNLNSLVMSDCRYCVIGQAIGDYSSTVAHGASVRETPYQWAIDHGFTLLFVSGSGWLGGPDAWHQLESLWSEEVLKRLG